MIKPISSSTAGNTRPAAKSAALVRKLDDTHRAAVLLHFLTLAADDRHLRFGSPTTDAVVEHYVANLDFSRDALFGVFNDALELSSIVMAADGVIAETEMAMLRSFAKELGVNLEDLQNIADKHVAGAKATTTDKSEVTDESLIGIDPKADKAVIKRVLIEAFGKYNARLQTEKEPARRAYFQDMLNAVARLRKKYA